MSLTYAILNALKEKPSTGADLVRRFDKSVGYFWNCTHQQIYRELKKLAGKAWIRSEPSDHKAGSFVYELEASGEQALRDWIEEDRTYPVIRDPFLVKIRAISNFDELSPVALFEEKRRHHEEKLRTYQQIAERVFRGPLDRRRAIRKMVLDAGMNREKSSIQWCNECLEILASPDLAEQTRDPGYKGEPE